MALRKNPDGSTTPIPFTDLLAREEAITCSPAWRKMLPARNATLKRFAALPTLATLARRMKRLTGA